MGGSSGGGTWGDATADEVAKQVREASDRTVDATYEAECNAFLASLLPAINNRDVTLVNGYLEQIATALGRQLDGDLELLLGGSVAKHTYVDGLSDIDALVLVDESELADSSPAALRQYIAERLQARFRGVPVEVGRLAVTVAFPEVPIQLLPALRQGERLRIADPSGRGWSEIRPREFARALTATNQANGGKVVPTIKLAKSLLAGLPEAQRLSGYHVESLAVEVFRGYGGSRSLRAMLRHFFEQASRRVLSPIVDRTGQSVHVDDDLGPPDSPARQLRAAALGRIARQMAHADSSADLAGWKNLLED